VKRGAKGVNKPFFVTAIAMFLFSSTHVVGMFVQAIRTFIYGDPVSLPLFTATGILYNINR
jgi:hypothetical protein